MILDSPATRQRLQRRGCGATPFLLALFCVIPVFAQTEISQIQFDAITHSTARVGFETAAAFKAYIQYGTTPAYGYRSETLNTGKNHGIIVLTGMQPATQYHFRVCNAAFTPPEGCSSSQVLKTAAEPSPHPAEPAMPSIVDTAYPVIDGSTYMVAPDCSDFKAKLDAARAQDGNRNHQVVIPAGAVCAGMEAIGPKTGPNPHGKGTIVIRSAGKLPPEGTRIEPALKAETAVFLHRSIADTRQANDPAACTPRQYYWNTTLAGANKYKICTAPNVWEAVSQQPGYAEGTAVPKTCVPGRYFYETSAANSRHGLHYCHSSGRFIRLEPAGDGRYSISVPERYQPAAVTGYRFVGLRFEGADEKLIENARFVYVERGAARVIFDRCLLLTGPANTGTALDLSGSRVALIDSYIAVRPSGQRAGATTINIQDGSGPFKIVNNYIEGSNILIFVTDNSPALPRDDIEIRRNHLRFDSRTNQSMPEYDGLGWRDTRAPIELKRGRRVWIDGNIIENFWSRGLSNAPAILITPRASGMTAFDGSAHQVSDVRITNNVIRHGSGVIQVQGQDDVGYRNTHATARVLIENNLAYDIDGTKWKDTDATRGAMFWFGMGGEDYIVRHNTLHDVRGTGPAILTFTAPIEGLQVLSNIFWLNHGAAGGGDEGGGVRWYSEGPGFGDKLPNGKSASDASAALKLDGIAARLQKPAPIFFKNVIVGGAGGDTSEYRKRYPADNYWPGDRKSGESAIRFTNVAEHNFRLMPASPYRRGGPSPAHDGADAGVDYEQLVKALGAGNSEALAAGVRSSGGKQ